MTTNSDDRIPELAPVPPPLTLERSAHGQLRAVRGEKASTVRAIRCFPWTLPQRYISLRDDEDNEVALVEDPADLDANSRAALDESLAEAGFLFEIRRILHVDEEVEIRSWTVETTQGPRNFQTARDAWPQQLPSGDYLIRDVAGDLYRITETARADPSSRPHLWAFVE